MFAPFADVDAVAGLFSGAMWADGLICTNCQGRSAIRHHIVRISVSEYPLGTPRTGGDPSLIAHET